MKWAKSTQLSGLPGYVVAVVISVAISSFVSYKTTHEVSTANNAATQATNKATAAVSKAEVANAGQAALCSDFRDTATILAENNKRILTDAAFVRSFPGVAAANRAEYVWFSRHKFKSCIAVSRESTVPRSRLKLAPSPVSRKAPIGVSREVH
jgi:hypothetical protein